MNYLTSHGPYESIWYSIPQRFNGLPISWFVQYHQSTPTNNSTKKNGPYFSNNYEFAIITLFSWILSCYMSNPSIFHLIPRPWQDSARSSIDRCQILEWSMIKRWIWPSKNWGFSPLKHQKMILTATDLFFFWVEALYRFPNPLRFPGDV